MDTLSCLGLSKRCDKLILKDLTGSCIKMYKDISCIAARDILCTENRIQDSISYSQLSLSQSPNGLNFYFEITVF